MCMAFAAICLLVQSTMEYLLGFFIIEWPSTDLGLIRSGMQWPYTTRAGNSYAKGQASHAVPVYGATARRCSCGKLNRIIQDTYWL